MNIMKKKPILVRKKIELFFQFVMKNAVPKKKNKIIYIISRLIQEIKQLLE